MPETTTLQTEPLTRTQLAQRVISKPLAARRAIHDKSLYKFLQYFFPIVSSQEFKGNWHIEYLCNELEKVAEDVANRKTREYDLIVNVPPGTTKTITCSIMFPAWCWTKWPWMRFICGSYSSALSLESAEYCRDLIRSDAFKAVYPDIMIKDDKDTKSNFKIVKVDGHSEGYLPRLIQGGNRFSTSVGATITGFHGDILLIDDPLNPEQAASEKELENCNRWMEQTLPSRKTDKAVSLTVLIMQRLHQNDPTGMLLNKKKKKIKHISLPGEIRNYRSKLNPPELAEHYIDDLLDPGRMSWSVLDDMEADLGQYGYAGQIGQDPSPPGGGMFKVDHLITLNALPSPVNFVEAIRYWDKAGSDGKGAFTAGVKISKLQNGRFIIQDVRRGQWATEERERIIKETAFADREDARSMRHPEPRIWIEQEPGSGGKESAEATIRNLAGFACYKECPTGDKAFRADPFSVQVNNGNVLLLVGEWNHLFIEELRYFPFSTYKDQVDAGSGAFNKLAGKRIARRVT